MTLCRRNDALSGNRGFAIVRMCEETSTVRDKVTDHRFAVFTARRHMFIFHVGDAIDLLAALKGFAP